MKGLVSDTNLKAIGNAIREKTGKTATIKVADMAEEIKSIKTRPMFIIKKADGTNKPVWSIVSSKDKPEGADVWTKGV